MLCADGISDFQSSRWRQTGRVQCGSIVRSGSVATTTDTVIPLRDLYVSHMPITCFTIQPVILLDRRNSKIIIMIVIFEFEMFLFNAKVVRARSIVCVIIILIMYTAANCSREMQMTGVASRPFIYLIFRFLCHKLLLAFQHH